jgi:hypothetical protein
MPHVDEGSVQATAMEIIQKGTAYNYILDVWRSRYFGTPLIGKVLLISVGSGSIISSKGIHVQICGKGGSGKSAAATIMAGLMPPEWVLDSAVTPQALFYPAENFIDNSIVFIDDIVWKDDLGTSVKRITAKFQQGAKRLVTTDGISKQQISKKRLTFWVTSVDSQADEQIRDRFILVECDSSKGHVQEIINKMKARAAGKGVVVQASEFETAVCQALIRHIKNYNGEVVIPFAEEIEFKGEIRAWTMFEDMIKSFALFRDGHKIDEDGNIVAKFEDFENALALYSELGGHSTDKYTKAEMNFLMALKDFGGKATKAQMEKLLNLSLGRIGDILNGRGKGDQEKHGLFYKCSYLSIDNSVRPYLIVLDDDWSPELDKVSRKVGIALDVKV